MFFNVQQKFRTKSKRKKDVFLPLFMFFKLVLFAFMCRINVQLYFYWLRWTAFKLLFTLRTLTAKIGLIHLNSTLNSSSRIRTFHNNRSWFCFILIYFKLILIILCLILNCFQFVLCLPRSRFSIFSFHDSHLTSTLNTFLPRLTISFIFHVHFLSSVLCFIL